MTVEFPLKVVQKDVMQRRFQFSWKVKELLHVQDRGSGLLHPRRTVLSALLMRIAD